MSQRVLIDRTRMELVLLRLAHQLLEHHPQLENCCLVGIQPRGVLLARRVRDVLNRLYPDLKLPYAELDVTFHRDDLRRSSTPIVPESTHVPPDFTTEDRVVILVDDVLYTGRTVQAALAAILAFGRPRSTELLVLVDRRRKRELPIEAHYVGVAVDTLDHERVLVRWPDNPAETNLVVIQSQHHV